MDHGSVVGVFQLHGITRDGMATRPFGSWWEALRHDARAQLECWVLTTSVVAESNAKSARPSYMTRHNEDTLVTCNGVLLVIEGQTLAKVQSAWMFVSGMSVDQAALYATSQWPSLPNHAR